MCIAYVNIIYPTCILDSHLLLQELDFGLLLLNTLLQALKALSKLGLVLWSVPKSSLHLVQLYLSGEEYLLLGVDQSLIKRRHIQTRRGLDDAEGWIAVVLGV